MKAILVAYLTLVVLIGCSAVTNYRKYELFLSNWQDVTVRLEVQAEHSDQVKQDTSPPITTDLTVPLLKEVPEN